MQKRGLFTLAFTEIRHPGKTYFFKRKDGSIFPGGAKEAHELRRRLELVGVSDGNTYYETMKKAVKKQDDAIQVYEEKMEDLQEAYDDKEIKATEYARKKKILKTMRKKIASEARKAAESAIVLEQKAAIGKMEMIPDLSTVVYDGFAQVNKDIQSLIG